MPRSSAVMQRHSLKTLETGHPPHSDATMSDEAYQARILPLVSRTFALTIPQLPPRLRSSVATAYLLCRIADTIEDEPAICADLKLVLLERFAATVRGRGEPKTLGCDIAALLTEQTSPAERDLVSNLDRVIRLLQQLSEYESRAVERCLAIMCRGMHRYQQDVGLQGLARMTDLDGYCYCVAGVVGEMLTDLFSAHCTQFARKASDLRSHAASFGQGLQMTNILKDIWEDRERGACWLPRDVFRQHGLSLEDLSANRFGADFASALRELIGLAHAHLRNGFAFTLAVPLSQPGIRRFCFLAIGLALLTLRKIHNNPAFTLGADVKIKRSAVFTTKLLTDVAVQNDHIMRGLFKQAAHGLPLREVSPHWGAHFTAVHAHDAIGEHG